MAGSATPTSSAGHATRGAPTNPELTLRPDHSSGADQCGGHGRQSRVGVKHMTVVYPEADCQRGRSRSAIHGNDHLGVFGVPTLIQVPAWDAQQGSVCNPTITDQRSLRFFGAQGKGAPLHLPVWWSITRAGKPEIDARTCIRDSFDLYDAVPQDIAAAIRDPKSHIPHAWARPPIRRLDHHPSRNVAPP